MRRLSSIRAARFDAFPPNSCSEILIQKLAQGNGCFRFSALQIKATSHQIAAAKLLRSTRLRPRLAIVLGTGFQGCLDSLTAAVRVSYKELAGFPRAEVTGHRGELSIGCVASHPVMVLRGRAHFYEGHPMSMVTAAVSTIAAFGIRALLLTNAAGGINPKFRVGDLMIVEDHLNFMGVNPLRGLSGPEAARFVDLSQVYDPRMRRLLHRAGRDCSLKLKTGVYAAVSGPSFETPAEIRAFGKLGADAVGMSTVPEAIVARALGLRVAAVSCITNLAAGRAKAPLSHREVLEAAEHRQAVVSQFLEHFVTLHGTGGF